MDDDARRVATALVRIAQLDAAPTDEGRLMARNELLELRGRVDGWLSGL